MRIGESKRAEITVANRGRVTLQLQGFDRTQLPAVFRTNEPPATLASNSTTTFTFIFAPDTLGPVSGKIVLLSDSKQQPRLELSLTGIGVETMVKVSPETVDFGAVEVDSRVSRNITLVNEGEIAEDISVLTLADGSPHFSGGPVPGGGKTIHLEPGATAELPTAFTPHWADKSGFVSSVTLAPCPTCSTITVTLRGVGVDSFLTVDPTPPKCLDFGLVNPGETLTKNFTVNNLGTLDLHLITGTVTQGAGKFVVGQTFPVTIGGESQVMVPVTYQPTELTTDNGTLTLTSDDPKAANVQLCMKGTGGGPDISVQPPALAFGQVAVGSPRTRTVRVSNVGRATGTATPVPLIIDSATITSGATTGYSVEFAPFSLAIGESKTITVSFAPTAEGNASDTLVLTTNDSDSPTVSVSLTGQGRVLAPCELELIPVSGTLAFGNVDRGRYASLPFAVRNTSTNDCLIDSMEIAPGSNAAFTFVTAPDAQMVLTPGESRSFAVQFHPLVNASYTGQIRFSVSNPTTPTRTIELTGLSTPGCLLVSPTEIDFGTVGVQCVTNERTVNIYNVCANSVDVSGVTLAADPSNSYALNMPAISFPVTMTGATSLSLKVRYFPQTFGAHPGGIYIQSSERTEPYLVSLEGSAQPNAVQTDHFSQSKMPVDILFVIDNSGSMGDEQASLAANLTSFMKFADKNFVDYHIAVTTTDVDSASGAKGRFVPLTQTGTWPNSGATPPRVLTRNTPDVLRAFQTNVNVGITGSGTEQGFAAAYEALSPQLLASHNQGFLRDDAVLLVIVMTDELEQSPQALNFYYSFLINIKGARRANMFSWSSICSIDPGDTGNYGERYIEMSKRTGGVTSSIHTANWAVDLEKLGLQAFGYKSTFLLTSTPDISTIKVRLNGNEVPQSDPESTYWTYDPLTNIVQFSPQAIPEPGQDLEISYSVLCGP